ncbi:MAG: thermonuclease family protein [Planctomycetaceae bacterium]|nr:thermonuclease family protein [Planctomycetaceae bacterium]
MRLRRWPTASWLIAAVVFGLLAFRLLNSETKSLEGVFAESFVGVERVIDGDTILVESGQRVRLIGVDTPETKHPDRPVEQLGKEAFHFTQSLVGDGPVRLEFDRERRDPYRRLLAYVYLPDERLLNEQLILAGYSEAETNFPFRSDMKRRFQQAETVAREAKRGLWSIDEHVEASAPAVTSQSSSTQPVAVEAN